MQIQDLVGSLLSLTLEPITNAEMCVIKNCLEEYNIEFISSYNISNISYQLIDYDNYFDISKTQINVSSNYYNSIHLIKKRFFDSLNDDDKLVIYKIINNIK